MYTSFIDEKSEVNFRLILKKIRTFAPLNKGATAGKTAKSVNIRLKVWQKRKSHYLCSPLKKGIS